MNIVLYKDGLIKKAGNFHGSGNINMTKKILRQHFLAQRKAFSPKIIETKSQQITNQLFDFFDFSELNVIHTFLPIVANHEINTWLIINKIWTHFSQLTVVVPKSNFVNYTLQSYILKKDTHICENQWHIPEPVNAQRMDDQEIDIVLLPLICFDKCGFRVGYGKGFYDRFLTRCRADVVKVGLSFFPPVHQIEDIHSLDIKMDYCVIVGEVFKF